ERVLLTVAGGRTAGCCRRRRAAGRGRPQLGRPRPPRRREDAGRQRRPGPPRGVAGARGAAGAVPDRAHRCEQRRVRGVRGGDGPPHGRRGLRLVLRVRRSAASRLPADPRRRAGAVVAGGARRGLGPPRGTRLRARGTRGPPRRARVPPRRRGVRRVAGRQAPDGGRVGARRPRRPGRRPVPMGRRARAGRAAPDERLAGHVPVRGHRGRRLAGHLPGGRVPRQRLRAAQHHRQRLGVERGPVVGDRPQRDHQRGQPRRVLPVPRVVLPPLPGLRPAATVAGLQRRQPRVPGRRGRL
ncbi:MAG: Sulfatase modifying factor 1 precursor (C-alpha-formyglycine- generating enzyme 1), partial [uncultured Nocardioidaceae bacterium]